MKLVKFFVAGCCLFFVTASLDRIRPLCQYQNQTNITNAKAINEIKPENDVTIIQHGSFSKQIRNIRRDFFLNLFMSPKTYNDFNLIIDSRGPAESQLEFYHRLTQGAERKSVFFAWNNAADKMGSILKRRSTKFGFSPSFFTLLFKNWFFSTAGWQAFRDVFRGVETENNLFIEPTPNMSSQDLQKLFRKKGIIFQITFAASGLSREHWEIINQLLRISPQIDDVKALKYYYLRLVFDESKQKWLAEPPLIHFIIADPKEVTVKQNLSVIRTKIEIYFGFEQEVFPDLIRINPDDYNRDTYENEITVTLFFNKFDDHTKIYRAANIFLQGNF